MRKHPAGWSLAVADPTQKQRRPVEIEIEMGNRIGARAETGKGNPFPGLLACQSGLSCNRLKRAR